MIVYINISYIKVYDIKIYIISYKACNISTNRKADGSEGLGDARVINYCFLEMEISYCIANLFPSNVSIVRYSQSGFEVRIINPCRNRVSN